MFVERKFHRLPIHNLSLSLFLTLFILNQRYDELIRFILKVVELLHAEPNVAVGVSNLPISHEDRCAYFSSSLRILFAITALPLLPSSLSLFLPPPPLPSLSLSSSLSLSRSLFLFSPLSLSLFLSLSLSFSLPLSLSSLPPLSLEGSGICTKCLLNTLVPMHTHTPINK